ncbi:MAG: hypothetical protein ABSH51_28760 [Solirubrobacteraceae bacterium]
MHGLGGFSGLAQVSERPRLDRRLGHAGGDELRAELLAALGIIEATRAAQVAFGRLTLSWLANMVGFDECRLVLVLEVLYGGEGQDLRGVQAGAIADFLVDPPGGVIEDRRRGLVVFGVAPAVGFLPHVGDIAGRGCLPPSGIEHRLQMRGGEVALGVDPGFHRPNCLFAVALRLLDRLLTGGDRTTRDDGGRGERELELAFDLFGDSV